MTHPKNISILDYTYQLPDERIAHHPLPERDASRLLHYRQGQFSETTYRHLADQLPADATLVFNNTRVINARLAFQRATGGRIEIFCLEPASMIRDYQLVMNQTGSAQWRCLVGNAAKWKDEILQRVIGTFQENEVILSARKIEKGADDFLVELSWQPASLPMAEIFEMAGDIPLPPYIKRKAEADDRNRYQTIYAEQEGSVAAPTAGLHFTNRVFDELAAKGIRREEVTLHVGAGTFKPVKADKMEGHEMHAEWIDVTAETIQRLLRVTGPVIAVGTTSLRTLESLYWMGVKVHLDPATTDLSLKQWDVYESPLLDNCLSMQESFQSLLTWMQNNRRKNLFTQTQILIAPGYSFRVASGLITNFHQPQSTLLLLVAAAIGEDWKKLYQYALDNGFRFLSYGDGSLLEF